MQYKRKTCSEDSCKSMPVYSEIGSVKREKCTEHAADNMIKRVKIRKFQLCALRKCEKKHCCKCGRLYILSESTKIKCEFYEFIRKNKRYRKKLDKKVLDFLDEYELREQKLEEIKTFTAEHTKMWYDFYDHHCMSNSI